MKDNEKSVTISESEYSEFVRAKHMYDSFLKSDGLYSIDRVAKFLQFEGGRNSLIKRLIQDEIFMKPSENTPLQKYVDRDYFRLRMSHKYGGYYDSPTYIVTYTTHKGLLWLCRWYGDPRDEEDKKECKCFKDKDFLKLREKYKKT
ncbi:MAG: phage antirepressor KilAC domain-containing protein [Leptospira sp.]|nr:phage antirepressor KilAC domain-containing protein [Leptospira sp.]